MYVDAAIQTSVGDSRIYQEVVDQTPFPTPSKRTRSTSTPPEMGHGNVASGEEPAEACIRRLPFVIQAPTLVPLEKCKVTKAIPNGHLSIDASANRTSKEAEVLDRGGC